MSLIPSEANLQMILELGQFADPATQDAILKEQIPGVRLGILGQLLAAYTADDRHPNDFLVVAMFIACKDYLNAMFEAGGVNVRIGEAKEVEPPAAASLN